VAATKRRPGPTVRTKVTELTGTGEVTREDRLATEEPLEIRLAWPGRAAHRVWVTMRTPGHDFELAVGYLLHEGTLEPAHLRTVAYCTDEDLDPAEEFNVVTVTLDAPPHRQVPPRHTAASSGSAACGVCGKDSIAEALRGFRGSPWAGPELTADVVRALPETLRKGQTVFDKTGGVHAAGLADEFGQVTIIREDVGRHNAVDKVTGARVLAGQPTTAAALVLSGRIGFELVQKAAAAGIGTLIAVGAPSSLAVELARESGLHLYGFTSPHRSVQYN
jgi:FdhD protein